MRTYAQWLSTDQKNRCGALSTLSSDLLLKQIYWRVTGECHSFEKQRERNRKTARPTILGNLTSNYWEDFDAKATERKESKIFEIICSGERDKFLKYEYAR